MTRPDVDTWVTFADQQRIRRINFLRAVGRAKAKLTVYEWNAFALYLKAEVLADLKATRQF